MFLGGLLAFGLERAGVASAREIVVTNSAEVVAAFLHAFPAYVSWPANGDASTLVPMLTTNASTNALKAAPGPWRVVVLGRDIFGESVVRKTFENHPVKMRDFKVTFIAPGQPVPDCDLLFVSTHDREEITQALASASGRPILTVGDADDFLSAGGMIAMEREGDGIRFNVNLNNTRAMGFQVSGAMLQSANRIYDGSRIIKH